MEETYADNADNYSIKYRTQSIVNMFILTSDEITNFVNAVKIWFGNNTPSFDINYSSVTVEQLKNLNVGLLNSSIILTGLQNVISKGADSYKESLGQDYVKREYADLVHYKVSQSNISVSTTDNGYYCREDAIRLKEALNSN